LTTTAQSVSGSAGYIALPVTTDPDQLAADALGYLALQQPGWVAREGHLEVWLIRAFARMCAETASVAAQVPLAIFQYFGTQLLGLPPLVGATAGMASTWNLTDSNGHLIPAGTNVAYRVSSKQTVLFQTAADVTVVAGQSSTGVGQVPLVAVAAGSVANGLGPSVLAPVDSLSFVSSVISTTTSAGGADAETQAQYLDRLAAELQLLAPRPIIPSDFAALARNQSGVARAAALDGYNPADSSTGNARMVAVAVVDPAGNALPTASKALVTAALQAQREINFVVNVVDPTYTAVRVTAQLVSAPGYNTDSVTAAATAALQAFLSPANWGGPGLTWTNTTVVRYLTVGGILDDIPGVRYVSSLTIGIGAGSLVAGDGTLPGPIPLPTVGAMNITTTAALT
jgi:hypothetical protein